MFFKKVRKIWQTILFSLVTATLGLGSIIVGMFNGKGSRRFGNVWGKFLCWLCGFKLEIQGLENLPSDGGGYVLASNHQSAADIAVVLAGIPADICWVAKESLLKVPFIGWHLKIVHIPVARSKSGNTTRLLENGAQKIRDGATVVVFPEGTRNRNPEHLLPFRRGAFFLAKAAGRPIIPVGIYGSAKLMKPEILFPEKGVIKVNIGQSIDPNQYADDDLEGLAAETRTSIQLLLGHAPDEPQMDQQAAVAPAAG